jgi:cyanophycinase
VTIFDPSQVVTNAYEAKRSSPLLVSGVVLHALPHGSRFDLTTRTLIPPPRFADPAEAAEMAEAGKDLRQLARDIAAADASPTALRRRRARTRRKTEHPHQDGASS